MTDTLGKCYLLELTDVHAVMMDVCWVRQTKATSKSWADDDECNCDGNVDQSEVVKSNELVKSSVRKKNKGA